MVQLSDNAKTVIERRIAPRDDAGMPLETPDEIFDRVARVVAQGTDNPVMYERLFRTMLHSLDFLPNSPCLVNAGRSLGQLSACFVLPVEDSIVGIFDAVKQTALIHKSGGGTGFSFSRLRAKNSMVASTAGVASGPVSFMKIFDVATEQLKQGGTRRGANMGILSIDHPDIMEFINVKANRDQLQNFNISIGMSDEFMWLLREDPSRYWKSSGATVQEIWNALIHNAWLTGDPGLIFIDRINAGKANPVPTLGPIEATNPCGEQPLYPFDSCNLGSINLSNFVRPDGTIDRTKLEATTRLAVQFLDAVITVNKYPIPEIQHRSLAIRRIGLGVMGFADMLFKMQVRYDSERALDIARKVMSIIQTTADDESRKIAQDSGSFPLYKESIYSESTGMRNSTRTTIAPTGTISIIAGCSSGIEPMFGLVFERSHYLDRTDGSKRHTMLEINPLFQRAIGDLGRSKDWENGLYQHLLSGRKLADYPDVPQTIIDVFRTAHDISPKWHVKMQAIFQEYTDNAVSKTINFPHEATEADVAEAYLMAYDLNCLGITVYRDGSHDDQVLSFAQAPEPTVAPATVEIMPSRSYWRQPMPIERNSVTHKFTIGEFEGYMTVGLYPDGSPGEVFLNGSKQGSTISGLLDTIAVLISYGLQHGIPLDQLMDKLRGSRFEPAGLTNNPAVGAATSVMDYVARYLLNRFPTTPSEIAGELTVSTAAVISTKQSGMLCPDCQSMLQFGEGCLLCPACGYNKCG